MHMRANQARNYNPPLEINSIFLGILGREAVSLADISDPVALRKNRSIENNIPVWIDGYDRCMDVQHLAARSYRIVMNSACSDDEDIYSLLIIGPKKPRQPPRQDIEATAGSGPLPLCLYTPSYCGGGRHD